MVGEFSLTEALGGEEGPFLVRVLGAPYGREGLAEYRVFLEGRGDPRGELLRVQDALLDGASEAEVAGLRARLEELLSVVDGLWWRCVDRLGRVRNCGQAIGEEPVVRFAFECPMRWEALVTTADAKVRWCGECGERVVQCGTRSEAEAQARLGRCISVPAKIAGAAGAEATTMVTGRPDPMEYWGRRIFPGR